MSNVSEEFFFFLRKTFFTKTKTTITQFAINTSSTTFVTCLFCTNMLTIYSIYTTYNTETTTTVLAIQHEHY